MPRLVRFQLRTRAAPLKLGGSERLEELEKGLTLCLAPDDNILNIDSSQPVISTQLQISNNVLSFFSIIAQLITVQDVTVSEYKVELMFPTNKETEIYYKK
ncbi:MAG: hypothetical protein KAH20_15535 [Methylococcales bacterium]|nr:hypothetical protein [Methylococcales bacterium]